MKFCLSLLLTTLTVLIATFDISLAIEAGADADCLSHGYGYMLCPGAQQNVCYNPGLGQTCCTDGCVCLAGFQCPSTGSDCIPVGSPTVSMTSIVEGTVTVTTFSGGLTSTLTLIPAQISVSGAPPASTEQSLTIQTSLPPCPATVLSSASIINPASSFIPPNVTPPVYPLTTSVGPQDTSLATNSLSVASSFTPSLTPSDTTVSSTDRTTSIASGATSSGIGSSGGHTSDSSTIHLTTPPTASISQPNSHSGAATTHGSSTSAMSSITGYTGTSDTGKMLPASLFAYVVAVTCMVVF